VRGCWCWLGTCATRRNRGLIEPNRRRAYWFTLIYRYYQSYSGWPVMRVPLHFFGCDFSGEHPSWERKQAVNTYRIEYVFDTYGIRIQIRIQYV